MTSSGLKEGPHVIVSHGCSSTGLLELHTPVSDREQKVDELPDVLLVYFSSASIFADGASTTGNQCSLTTASKGTVTLQNAKNATGKATNVVPSLLSHGENFVGMNAFQCGCANREEVNNPLAPYADLHRGTRWEK